MKVKYHDPENYTISVRKETHDSEELWVARVAELPDIMEFGESREDAYSSALFTIKVGQEMCLEDGTPFPAPIIFEAVEGSGRVTLRLRASTKAQAVRVAEKEGVSLNTYLATCIERDIGRDAATSSVQLMLSEMFEANISKIFTANNMLIRGLGKAFQKGYTLQIGQPDMIIQSSAEDEGLLKPSTNFFQHRGKRSLAIT